MGDYLASTLGHQGRKTQMAIHSSSRQCMDWIHCSHASQESGTWVSAIQHIFQPTEASNPTMDFGMLRRTTGGKNHFPPPRFFSSKRALDWENFYGYDFHEDLEITRDPAGIYSTEVYAARAEQIIRWHSSSWMSTLDIFFKVSQQQHSNVHAFGTPVSAHPT